MKKINYKGSLTDDLDTLNNRNDEKDDSLETLFLIIKRLSIVVLVLLFLSALFGQVSPVVISSLCSSITAITLSSSVRNSRKSITRYNKLHAESQIHSLLYELSKNKDYLSSDFYKLEDIINAAVIEQETNNDDKDKNASLVDIEDYLDEITSDIYIVNKDAKIMVLREIKNIMTYGDNKRHVTGSSTLYELEGEEIPKREEMPVKHVLKLRDDKSGKNTL